MVRDESVPGEHVRDGEQVREERAVREDDDEKSGVPK